MTSSLHRKFRGQAFTLIELMVVIGLIVLLIALAVPMIGRARRNAVRTAMAADLAIIANGLEAYRADFGDYPRMGGIVNGASISGANLLCWAMVAPGPAKEDGNDGPGFRTRGVTGAVKGPYLPVDRFTVGMPTPEGIISTAGPDPNHPVDPATVVSDYTYMIADRYLHPILYFPANKAADPYSTSVGDGAYVSKNGSPLAVFNYSDNHPTSGIASLLHLDMAPNKMSSEVMCWRLGATGKIPPDGTLRPSDTPATTGPYLLWSAGNDGLFGSNDDLANSGVELQLNTTSVPNTFGNADPNPKVQ